MVYGSRHRFDSSEVPSLTSPTSAAMSSRDAAARLALAFDLRGVQRSHRSRFGRLSSGGLCREVSCDQELQSLRGASVIRPSTTSSGSYRARTARKAIQAE